MMREFTREKLATAYAVIGKWTNWWLTCRDFDRNGLVEYLDGCDSGWDNSTAIVMNRPPLVTPDLQAFLILQMQELADLAKTLGRERDAAQWTARAKKMLDALVPYSLTKTVRHVSVALWTTTSTTHRFRS